MQVAINKKVDLCWVLSYVAEQSNLLSGPVMQSALQDGAAQPLLGASPMTISFVAGTIKDGEEQLKMQRMLFRATRGKALT